MKINYLTVTRFCAWNALIFMLVGLVSFLFFHERNLNTFLIIVGVFSGIMEMIQLLKIRYDEKH